MQKFQIAALTGIAALTVAGLALVVGQDTRMIEVDLPNGAIARIEYQGGLAPQVSVAPTLNLMPTGFTDLSANSAFAAFERIESDLHRQAELMMQDMDVSDVVPIGNASQLDLNSAAKLPAGTVHYSFVSTSTKNGTCTRSVEVTSDGTNASPKVVSHTSGSCDAIVGSGDHDTQTRASDTGHGRGATMT